MKTAPIVILGLLATVGAATRSGQAHTKHQAAGRSATSTIASTVQQGSNTVLALQAANATLTRVKVSAVTPIGTQNAGHITADDLRAGDRLVVQRDGAIQDLSQKTVDLSGVVAYAPTPNNDVMTVQVTPSRTVLVDVAPQTRFTDISQHQTGPSDIVDSDTVSIHGVLDTTLDEVVVAQGIKRLGPKISRSYTTG